MVSENYGRTLPQLSKSIAGSWRLAWCLLLVLGSCVASRADTITINIYNGGTIPLQGSVFGYIPYPGSTSYGISAFPSPLAVGGYQTVTWNSGGGSGTYGIFAQANIYPSGGGTLYTTPTQPVTATGSGSETVTVYFFASLSSWPIACVRTLARE
jgi:hypothetical protein